MLIIDYIIKLRAAAVNATQTGWTDAGAIATFHEFIIGGYDFSCDPNDAKYLEMLKPEKIIELCDFILEK